ncbi:MAG: zinc-dependent metalloprotease [Proteobacteria bacterium]|nr:zinc-dependent metalloprotease [Pseudomonadota bacterium]MDA0994987.1 zinc-dependent metalloprotease [Pseudomonadota bacterium]
MVMRTPLLALLTLIAACGQAPSGGPADIISQVGSMQHLPGFYDLYWQESKGRLIVRIDAFNEPFLYQSSMARGVGSNDLGLDRGQLGATRVVEFQRSGPKILLIEDNLDYRAQSDNVDEQAAVDESFAKSVIWGFESLGEKDGSVYIDATDFMIRDAHRIAARLAADNEGTFKPDASRSAIYMPNTKAFPDNSEVEAIVTFTGQATGPWLRTVTPDAESFSVHLHHSFIRLPDDNYEPLAYESRSGFFGRSFQDYATPVGDSLEGAFAARHRLKKKDPSAAVSEAVEPIIYYVDRGAPEPIRSALVEGASWWNQAFEAAGYKDAFQVQLLPEDADPMDVRFNVIQWVHRSTRGWSYGGSITDPRSGEIMKGKVTLGSLRVRQDYLIAEGLMAPYDDEEKPDIPMEMALARVRQLSAHEVGHTLGIQHNMAASSQGRTSVMDYPHPLIRFDETGNINLDEAYAVGIGVWDKRVILYGYQDFPDDADERGGRGQIMADTIESGLAYVSDGDSRPISSAHPLGNLWDNGADSVAELRNLIQVRAYAMGRFSERNIRPGRPMATLEEVLVPIYLIHRFQLIAVGKLIGGEEFNYALRGDGQELSTPVTADRQREAISALLNTLSPAVLRIPENVLRLIPPRPPGFAKSRETFPGSTGKIFEPFGAAQSAASLTLEVMLEPSRAARLIASNARQPSMPGFSELTDDLLRATWFAPHSSGTDGEIQRQTNTLTLARLMMLAVNGDADAQVRAIALDAVSQLDNWLAPRAASERDASWRAHYGFARFQIDQMRNDPSSVRQIEPVTVPPGEPIGTTLDWH